MKIINYFRKRAVMTFEEPLLEKAQKDIDATEKLCSTQTKKFSTFKKAFGISSSSSSNQLSNQQVCFDLIERHLKL